MTIESAVDIDDTIHIQRANGLIYMVSGTGAVQTLNFDTKYTKQVAVALLNLDS